MMVLNILLQDSMSQIFFILAFVYLLSDFATFLFLFRENSTVTASKPRLYVAGLPECQPHSRRAFDNLKSKPY